MSATIRETKGCPAQHHVVSCEFAALRSEFRTVKWMLAVNSALMLLALETLFLR